VTTYAFAARLLPALLLGLTTSCVPAIAAPLSDTATAKRALRLPFQIAELLFADTQAAGARRITAAAPFQARELDPRSSARALGCLTAAVYYEARSQAPRGQRAVAQVVLNRVRHYAYPSSICGVVFQGPMRSGGGCQFTFTCDGSLRRPVDDAAWRRAEDVARAALAGDVEPSVGWATHYHADYVRPGWGARLVRVAAFGAHIFYRMPGGAGEAGAFVRRSASLEPAFGARWERGGERVRTSGRGAA